MESKIQIDIDGSGMPQIKIIYRATDDVRDRLVSRFLSKMGIPGEFNGFWCYCRLGHETQSIKDGYYDGVIAFIEPMDVTVLGMHIPEIERILASHQKNNLHAQSNFPGPAQSIQPEFPRPDENP